MDTMIIESNTAGSLAEAHGLVPGEKLILTMPAIRQGKMQYDVQSLDIRTGITSLLVPNTITDPIPGLFISSFLKNHVKILDTKTERD